MRSIVNAKHGNNHILDFYIRYATLNILSDQFGDVVVGNDKHQRN